jgi:diguanylate cyclase (GGDEF)-like protein
VVFLGMDGFKPISDSLGRLRGDELLATVGRRLGTDPRSADMLVRFGGDEVAMLLHGLDPEATPMVVERLQERIAEAMMLGGHEVRVTASAGIVMSQTSRISAEDVLRSGGMATYRAKETGRGTTCVFDPLTRT